MARELTTSVKIDGQTYTANWVRSKDAGYSAGRWLLDLPNGELISVYRVGRKWIEAHIRGGLCRNSTEHKTRDEAMASATLSFASTSVPVC